MTGRLASERFWRCAPEPSRGLSCAAHMSTPSLYVKAPSFTGLRSASEAQSRAKRGNRARDTKPELMLRGALFSRGARYRVSPQHILGKPDVVFPRAMVAVFCDGDFWHGRQWPDAEQRLTKGANPDYWRAKIAYNMERDERVTRELVALGWCVLRFWESEIKADAGDIAGRVMSSVRARMGAS